MVRILDYAKKYITKTNIFSKLNNNIYFQKINYIVIVSSADAAS